MLTAVTGIKWGDEGKGRVIDLLAERADIVVRYQGGNNAGHTVVTKQGKFILNLLPSGILHPNVVCVLADGMVVDLEHLSNEIADIRGKGVSVTPQNFKLYSVICRKFPSLRDICTKAKKQTPLFLRKIWKNINRLSASFPAGNRTFPLAVAGRNCRMLQKIISKRWKNYLITRSSLSLSAQSAKNI